MYEALETQAACADNEIGNQLDHIFELMARVGLQASLIETFARINDTAGVRRQLKFLSAHVTSAIIASGRIDELKACSDALS